MIRKADKRVLQEFAERVRSREPRAQIWAFGSRARGDAVAESDFDICVALPKAGPEEREYVQEAAWEVGFEHRMVIAALCYSKREMFHGPRTASPLIRAILREGVAA